MNECDLFIAAMKLDDAAQRAAYLDEVCASDATLRQRVDALVGAYCQAGSFLEQPKRESVTTVNITQIEQPGSQVGRYKLREVLGEGGMGTVFVAEQEQPVRRKVALKLIKLGMDSRSVISRFEAERQALALMDHPNIAHVLDAGTTESGRPYFVMELVKGTSITEHCDTCRLGTRERLDLFLQVCQAVQHAHQKGIIHRDLKPSNILVAMNDATPVIKVIDFGVSKAIGQQLTDQTIYTGFNQIVGTPLYMSPEQAGQSNVDIDTRSDIYSLGVLLYEVLTGFTPFDSLALKQAGYDEMRRMIREVEPPRPSARISTLDAKHLSTVSERRKMEPRKFSQQLRGELDWIVMKAMEKGRNRRYETANAFARDVQRYLANEPVEARPASTIYRIQKMVQRNKGPVIAAGLVVATLLAGIVGTTAGLLRALNAESVAKQAEADTLAAYRASTDDAIEQLIGSKAEFGPKETAYLESTLKRWQTFAGRQGSDEQSKAIRAEGHIRVADLLCKLGKFQEALTEYKIALELERVLVKEFPTMQDYQWGLGHSHRLIGYVLARFGKHQEALAEIQAALEIEKKLSEQYPNVEKYQTNLVATYKIRAQTLSDTEKNQEALEQFQTAVELQTKIVNQFPSVPNHKYDLATLHFHLGRLKGRTRQSEALPDFKIASEILAKLVEQFPNEPSYQQLLAANHSQLSNQYFEVRKFDEAREELDLERALVKKLLDLFPSLAEHQSSLAENHGSFGRLQLVLGNWAEAETEFQAACERQEKVLGMLPEVPHHWASLALWHSRLAVAQKRLGKMEEALAQSIVARELESKLVKDFPDVPGYRKRLAFTCTELAFLHHDLANEKEAQAEFIAAIAIEKGLVEEFPTIPNYQIDLGRTYCFLGNTLAEAGLRTESMQWFDLSVKTLQRVHDLHPRYDSARANLRAAYMGRSDSLDHLQNYADSLQDLRQALELSLTEEQTLVRICIAISQIRDGLVDEPIADMAILTKNERAKEKTFDPEQWIAFANFYAIASSKIAQRKEEYAGMAVELLSKAVETSARTAFQVSKNSDFDPLRERADFQLLFSKPSELHLQESTAP